MGKLVVLKLEDSNPEQGFPVTLQIGEDDALPWVQIIGKLPPAPEVLQHYIYWQSTYRSLGLSSRLTAEAFQVTNVSIQEKCYNTAKELLDHLNAWLKSESFRSIREKLLERLMPSDEIRVIIQAKDIRLQRLPWHLWDWFDHYPKAEIALSTSSYEFVEQPLPHRDHVRILAVLGNSAGIDTQADRVLLEHLPEAEVTFLAEPQRRELNEKLWEQDWDILFFAGHSSGKANGESGQLYINQTDSLTINELKYALRKSVERGLKLVIFNSCDGLGLARELADLHIPQVIVMREPVPDQVAQEFLKYFLELFSHGKPFYVAVREAREKLQGLEDRFPCATWLPTICQNSAQLPPTWQDLRGRIVSNSHLVYEPRLHPITPLTRQNYCNHQDWGEAVDISDFSGRTEELTILKQWIVRDRCRLVVLLGMGGIGKTALSVCCAEQIQGDFEYVIWRSLRNSPPITEILADVINFLSNQQETNLSESVDGRISQLIECLRSSRCLLVLDNVEAILRSGKHTGHYHEGYEGYGELIKRLGEVSHQSCLMLTSREKPKEITLLEGKQVRSLQLHGLNQIEGKNIFNNLGNFSATDDEWQVVIEHYAGNPLALKIVAALTRDLLDNNISILIKDYLNSGQFTFNDIHDLLERQFNRLTDLEKEIMYWLAINREPVLLSELRADIVSPLSQRGLIDTLNSLIQRSLIQKSAAFFTQQPVVMEYMTEKLIENVTQEIETREIILLNSHALLKAQAKDYIRDTQIRLVLNPITKLLLNTLGKINLKCQLIQIISMLQEKSPLQPGYVGGNVLNLLCQLKIDLSGYDFSYLTVWQAYLQGVNLHHVNFAHSDLAKSIFTETLHATMSVAFSFDGKLLATSDVDGKICLWQVSNGKKLLSCKGHTSWVWSVSFSPNGQTLASGSFDHTVRLWDVSSGQCLKTLHGHADWVYSVVFSPNGQTLASTSVDQTIRLWDVSTGECLKTLHGHSSRVSSASFSLDGQILASGSEDKTIKLWDVSTGQCLKTLYDHTNRVRAVVFNPNGDILLSGSNDQTVKLWDISTGQCLKTLHEHSDEVLSVAFNPNGRTIASSSQDRTIKLWDVSTGQCLKTLQGHMSQVWSVAFSPNGQTLASGSHDQTVKLWDVSTGQCLKTLQGYTNWVWSVACSPDGQTLASGSGDKMIKLWDITTSQCLKTLQGHTNFVSSVAFSPQGKTLASGSPDQTVRLWDVNTGLCLKTLQGHTHWIYSVAFSIDGRMLASGSHDRTVKLWDISTGQCLRTLQGHTSWVCSVAFSTDSHMLASGSHDRTVKLWDVNTGQCLKTLQGHISRVWSVAFSSNGQTLASGGHDQTVKLWDVSTGQCLKTLQGHTSWVYSVAFSTDSRMLASGSHDGTIKLWDINTGMCLKTLHGYTSSVWSVACSPDAQTIASGSQDETIKLWNVNTGMCLKTLRAARPYEGMNITGVLGITEAQKASLKELGAVELID
ncbi:CHAT domain-containing protein [Nostoc sp.]|uniref:CHAT domain-containing protein n=1 Tax=Nostoc sp. TaxID=1180 RepID=UPI002FFA257E